MSGEFLQVIGWGNLLVLALFWLLAVALVLAVLHLLFPPLHRQSRERPDLLAPTAGSPLVAPPLTRPARLYRPAIAPAPSLPPAATEQWARSRRLVLGLLLAWAAISIGVPLLAPWLNRFKVLTGFPLGYYLSAQGTLVLFLLLVGFYIWRRRGDNAQAGEVEEEAGAGRASPRKLYLRYGSFAVALLGAVLLLGLLEERIGLSPTFIGGLLLFLPMGLYVVIGIGSRTEELDEYYVAGRRVPAPLNGLATGADWMSAASFISMAGTLWLLGFEGIAYLMGWTGGYVLLALLLAPYLRRFGQYTVPDFIGARFGGTLPRLVAALAATIVSFTYVTAQVTGIGIIMSRFLGVNYLFGVAIGLSLVLFCSLLGGMRAITWTQVAQGIVLIIAYLVPVALLSYRFTGVALPQLMYGQALEQIVQLEAAQGIHPDYVTPFNDWSAPNFLALALCLMLGTAGLPHILIRFYTTDSVAASRSSVGWALFFICLLYLTAPAYAAFARWEVLQNVVGRPIDSLPAWASQWERTGLLALSDLNGDGILQFAELRISPDLVVLAMPEIAGLPATVAALVTAGGLAAALSTADSLLMVIASAMAHDVYFRTLNPRASRARRLRLSRVMVMVAAILAAVTATRRLAIIVQMVAWAFSLAAAILFPALVLAIFWKRANGPGVVAGMVSGLLVTLTYMVGNYLDPSFNIAGISHVAAGIFGLPVNFLVAVLVSYCTAPPTEEARALVDRLRAT